MYEKLIEILKEYVKVDAGKITEDTNLKGDLGLNSLQMVNMAVAIEDEFDIEISDREASDVETVGDVMRLIESLA